MKFGRLGELKHGYNAMTTCESAMLMDIGYQVMQMQEEVTFKDDKKETAFVILQGEVSIHWKNQVETMKRNSIFDENPYCLHIPADVEVVIQSKSNAEILIQKTENDRYFNPKFYRPDDCQCDQFGAGMWNGTAERTVRTIFDYTNAPYSNMVNGEVVNRPGRWSGYIPHTHPQPEVYTYKFDKPQGFGCSFIGDDAYKISHNSYSAIPGGDSHPQVTAPGYAMWYSWMIRHLPNDPWIKTRTDDADHTWLLENNVKMWEPK